MERIDLHTHTTYSDGALDISSLLNEAKKRNVKTISIADHETIIGLNGYEKAMKELNIKIIPAIEMNVSLSGAHILGYGVTDFKKVENTFNQIKINNENIVYDIIKYLRKDGIHICENDVIQSTLEYHKNKKEKVENNSSIFKYQKEFVLVKTDIARAMVELKIVPTINDAYRKYLNNNQKKYCIKTTKIKTKDAIELINDNNGIAVLAHPMTVNTRKQSLNNICKELKNYGLSGIEVDGNRYSFVQSECYKNIAKQLKFLETVGSDFHRMDQNMGIMASNKIVSNLEQTIKEKKLIKSV